MTTITAPTTPTTNQNHAEHAILICCALAWHGNPLSGPNYDPQHVERTLIRARYRHTPNQLLQWRAHTVASSWGLRWRWARHVTCNHFPHAPGLDTLPLDHHDLPHTLPITP